MAEPLKVVDRQDNLWVRLRRNRDFRELFKRAPWTEKWEALSKKVRKEGVDQREADYARGFLAAMEWIKELPEREAKKHEQALDRALEKERLEAEQAARVTVPRRFKKAFFLRS